MNPELRIYLIIACIIPISFSCMDVKDGADSDRERIQQAVRRELKYHPEARLTDLYKLFFQEAFGPGHMISDESFALKYLREGEEDSGAVLFNSENRCRWNCAFFFF